MKYLLMSLIGAFLFPNLSLALEILCPAATVKELITVGVKPPEAVKLCENYIVCKTESKIKELEKIGYIQEEIDKICDVKDMEKVSESARNRALTSWRYAEQHVSQHKSKPCPAKIIVSIVKLGYNLEEGINYCKDYVVCKGKERKELEKIYSEKEVNKICEPSNNIMEQLNEDDKDILRAFIQDREPKLRRKTSNTST